MTRVDLDKMAHSIATSHPTPLAVPNQKVLPMTSSSTQSQEHNTGAAAALAGYDYQLDVSVLAALDLMLAKKRASAITLEPANQEDLEAHLDEAAPSAIEAKAEADTYRLILQVKRRSTEPWDIEAFKRLLARGKRRPPARKHLDDLMNRYVLVTDADATGVLRNLCVGGLDEWPPIASFPASLSTLLPHQPEGRIAIWAGLSSRLLELETNALLSELLHVPAVEIPACRVALREDARRRMRGSSPGVWTRGDLTDQIRRFGGYLASAPELDVFVPPANWYAITDRVRTRNAVVITGPSGTGKTTAAFALCEAMRNINPKLNVVTTTDSVSSVRFIASRGPTLFYVEDPWGQYTLRPGSETWTEQLPRLLRSARPDCQFIITTRTDMLAAGEGEDKMKSWSVCLDAEQYRGGRLADIHDKRLVGLAPSRQDIAWRFKDRTLDQLETPLEIDIYFSGLADGPEPGEGDEAFYRRVISLAHRDAIEDTVVKKLKAIDPHGWSAVIWCLLKTHGKVERKTLVAIQRGMRNTPAFSDGLERVTNSLVASRHLRQPGSAVAFSHPSVRAGLERAMRDDWGRSEQAILALVEALIAEKPSLNEWALETAARLVTAARSEFDEKIILPGAAQETIDRSLESALVDTGTDFDMVLELAAEVGSPASTPCELARWFTNGQRPKSTWFSLGWEPPSLDDAWYERVAADPRSRGIAERFVREHLPTASRRYGRGFVTRLDRIATELTPAFIDAARAVAGGGFDANGDTIGQGAVRDIDAFEDVLLLALDELALGRHEWRVTLKERRRAIDEDEIDKVEGEHFHESRQDDGYTAGVFISTYVEAVLTERGWQTLEKHPRAPELAWEWGRQVSNREAPPPLDEARALITAGARDKDEHRAWDHLRSNWQSLLAGDLERRVLDVTDDPELRSSLAACVIAAAPASIVSFIEAVSGNVAALVEILVDLRAAEHDLRSKIDPGAVASALKSGPAWAGAFYQALATEEQDATAVSREVADILEPVAFGASEAALAAIVNVLVASNGKPFEHIARWLDVASSSGSAYEAAKSAEVVGAKDLLQAALRHRFADARRRALEGLAPPESEPLGPNLLAMVEDPSGRVRQALVTLLGRASHAEHVGTLLRLAADDWSEADMHDDEPVLNLARQAVKSLGKYSDLDSSTGTRLVEIAATSGDRTLSMDALNVASALSTGDVRLRMWGIANGPVRGYLRIDTMDALACSLRLEAEIVDKITSSYLLGATPGIAVSATVLLAEHGDVKRVCEELQRVGHVNSRQALLLVGADRLVARGEVTSAGTLLAVLPDGHPARRLPALASGEKLPSSVLDDLGTIRLRGVVRRWLDDKIEK